MNAAEFHSMRKFAETPNARVAYFERGSGPVALLVHGFPLCGFQWRDVIEDLAPVRRCIAPDMLGLGYSEVAAGSDISFAAQAATIAKLLDALDIDKVDLVGNDSGGGVSQVFAASFPDRVRTLSLTDCEVNDLWPTPMIEPLFAALSAGLAGEMMKSMASDVAVARAQLAQVYENLDLDDAGDRADLLRSSGRHQRARGAAPKIRRGAQKSRSDGRARAAFARIQNSGAGHLGRGRYRLRYRRLAQVATRQSRRHAPNRHRAASKTFLSRGTSAPAEHYVARVLGKQLISAHRPAASTPRGFHWPWKPTGTRWSR